MIFATGADAKQNQPQAAPVNPLPQDERIELYQLDAAPGTAEELELTGLEIIQKRVANNREHLELTLRPADVKKLERRGLRPSPVRNEAGQTQLEAARTMAASGFNVWRSYSEPGGIADQLRGITRANPDVTELRRIGKTTQGKDILAVKVTRGARHLPDGIRPAVLYSATQHAREWISTEVDMRLLKYLIANKNTGEIKSLLNRTELWFVPVANPDGYDYTFASPDNRLWRKTLRDNNNDGQITSVDGVDPNRNFPTNFGYDEEGSSAIPSSETYRGPGPASEPETKAMDGLLRRIKFRAQVNYHSYGALLLYPMGWQVNTATADDPIYQALTGSDANPAVPGFDPDLGAELYTTNGETTDHAHAAYGTLAWTPELEEGCDGCGFVFPDDENLVQEQFVKNLPFALDVAKSAPNPTEPVSHLGNTTPDFVVDAFEVSHGRDQPVQVNVKRSLGPVLMHYQINGGRTKTTTTRAWQGGERYGKDYDTYYHYRRGTVQNAKPGDSVKVWFTAPVKRKTSANFTYRVAADIGGKVLILAAEDVTGLSPVQGVTTAKYADDHATALTAAGYTSDVYDVDAAGRKAPHPLGVLSHYKAVVWETGDDIIPRETTQVGGTVARLGIDIELAVRDYLNEGGKLVHSGKYASFAQAADGGYYFQPDTAQPECAVPSDPPCLPVLNDFQQYYLGAYVNVSDGGTDGNTGTPFPLKGAANGFAGFNGSLNGGDSANNQDHTASLVSTSAILPPDRFPQFATGAAVQWDRPGAPFSPHTGSWFVPSGLADISYKRLSRSIDLTGKSSGNLSFWTSYDTEANWDFLTVEARTAGQDDWTTLPDQNGHTTQNTGESCLTANSGGWREIHPFTQRYQGVNCEPTGTSGAWHAASGASGGWQQWSIDLTAYAGKQVEISIAYISDWSTQGLGVFLDDFKVTADGATAAETSFETDLGGWTVSGPPPGSASSVGDWARSDQPFQEGSVLTTKDTVFAGFGVEGLTTQAMRTDFMKRALKHLLG
ncbi:M14 family metallopeptidase [Rhizohabitans arisaemae]|uniref:M14 family metallopeptidase n=1 Tax=Rhizohabitans arisaemae TaxID=2720610 RepID=UPI0024B1A305|nr:M14 family metallopeptidase [Rhizohabitans arisaemae]